ncbi:hypothetical protein EDC04DRAFT_2604459 [Pisolithus marmoratus]|nr:hypothetical protein EDC04DRAFT_2604459 [Pisolithus marmoratus]
MFEWNPGSKLQLVWRSKSAALESARVAHYAWNNRSYRDFRNLANQLLHRAVTTPHYGKAVDAFCEYLEPNSVFHFKVAFPSTTAKSILSPKVLVLGSHARYLNYFPDGPRTFVYWIRARRLGDTVNRFLDIGRTSSRDSESNMKCIIRLAAGRKINSDGHEHTVAQTDVKPNNLLPGQQMSDSLVVLFANECHKPKLVIGVDEALTPYHYRPSTILCRAISLYFGGGSRFLYFSDLLGKTTRRDQNEIL